MTFLSTGLKPEGDDYILTGDLTIKGATLPIEGGRACCGIGPVMLLSIRRGVRSRESSPRTPTEVTH